MSESKNVKPLDSSELQEQLRVLRTRFNEFRGRL
jgi:hypothetical protein